MEEEVPKSSIVRYVLFSLIAVLLIFGLIVFLYSKNYCGDDTLYGKCSGIKPYLCLQGELSEQASFCGCPLDFSEVGEECFSEYKIEPKNVSLKYVLKDEESEINFIVYEGFYNYSKDISRFSSEEYSLTEFKKRIIENELQREMLMPLVAEIHNIADNEKDKAKVAISLVQNILYSSLDENTTLFKQAISSRYPYEVLYEMKGVCGEKSLLLAILLKELGYGAAIFYFKEESHEAVGIKCPFYKDYEDTGYCFIETTGLIGDNGEKYIGATQKFSSKPELIVISYGKVF